MLNYGSEGKWVVAEADSKAAVLCERGNLSLIMLSLHDLRCSKRVPGLLIDSADVLHSSSICSLFYHFNTL